VLSDIKNITFAQNGTKIGRTTVLPDFHHVLVNVLPNGWYEDYQSAVFELPLCGISHTE